MSAHLVAGGSAAARRTPSRSMSGTASTPTPSYLQPSSGSTTPGLLKSHFPRQRHSQTSHRSARNDDGDGNSNANANDAAAASAASESQEPRDDATNMARTAPVWPILQVLHTDIKTTIDTGLSWEELTGHELNFALVRPLAVKYSKLKSLAILYAMLITRVHFLREADRDLAYQSINQTRADLCEILAIKLLRTFAADGAELVLALSTPFWPLTGSDEETRNVAQRRGYECENVPNAQSTSALQLAIYSQAKKFIATPLVQKCVDGIWNGQIVLGNSTAGRGAIIEDSYKRRPVSFYDAAGAPVLDYHRLRVPRVRSFLEAVNFAFILTFYVLCLGSKGTTHWTASETLYTIWLTGLALDELAQFREHTAAVYFGSLFNVLDALFCINGFCWLGIRISALIRASPAQSAFSFDVLALGAILLCPRLASLLISDNVLMLALRAMVVEFGYFFGLALVFFSGFLWTFWSLADSPKWSPTRISWLMLRFTFGNTISFEEAQQFSATFGPILVVAFTILSQTLLLTILISLLSATFARVAAHAQEESLYQHSFNTLQGASSEALFSYFPPLNILCLLTILPASLTLGPRWTHKLNVFIIRTTHLPILLAIRLVQHIQWGRTKRRAIQLDGDDGDGGGIAGKSHPLRRWSWAGKRGGPDVIEVVFSDLAAKRAAQSDARPLSTTYHHGESAVLRKDSSIQEQQAGEQDTRQGGNDGKSGNTGNKEDANAAFTTNSNLNADFNAGATSAAARDRVQWAQDTYEWPDSPGATIRKARQETPGSTSALALARRDTFKELLRRASRGGGSSGGNAHKSKSPISPKTKPEQPDEQQEEDGSSNSDSESDADSHVLIPVQLVDDATPSPEGASSSSSPVVAKRPRKRRSGRSDQSDVSGVSSSSKSSFRSRRVGGLSPLTRVLSGGSGGGGGGGAGPSAKSPPMTRSNTEPAMSTATPAFPAAPPPSTVNNSAFSAYKLYRNSRSALLGKRRALSEEDVSPKTVLVAEPDADVDADADAEADDDELAAPGASWQAPTPAPAPPATAASAASGQEATVHSTSSAKQRHVRILPAPLARRSSSHHQQSQVGATSTNANLPRHHTASTDDSGGGLASLSRILHRKDTFDGTAGGGDSIDDDDDGGEESNATDTVLEQRQSADSAVQAIREVMLSFLERLDDQAEAVERIERMLSGARAVSGANGAGGGGASGSGVAGAADGSRGAGGGDNADGGTRVHQEVTSSPGDVGSSDEGVKHGDEEKKRRGAE